MSMAYFTDKLLKEFDKNMTDQVFLFIESNRELMSDYLHVVEKHSSLKVVNSEIAKAIKAHYNFQIAGTCNQEPKSILIQSFEEFKL